MAGRSFAMILDFMDDIESRFCVSPFSSTRNICETRLPVFSGEKEAEWCGDELTFVEIGWPSSGLILDQG